MIGIDMDASELGDYADVLREAIPTAEEQIQRATRKNSDLVVREAQHNAPIRNPIPFDYRKSIPGRMRASISSDMDGDDMGYEAGPTVDYAKYVEYDTVAHEIRSKSQGPMLAWPTGIGGHWARRERVWHPGTTKQPFMVPSFDEQLPPYIERLEDILERVL